MFSKFSEHQHKIIRTRVVDIESKMSSQMRDTRLPVRALQKKKITVLSEKAEKMSMQLAKNIIGNNSQIYTYSISQIRWAPGYALRNMTFCGSHGKHLITLLRSNDCMVFWQSLFLYQNIGTRAEYFKPLGMQFSALPNQRHI